MSPVLNCPKCGAPQQFVGNEQTLTCSFCGSAIIVPAELKPSLTTGQGMTDLKAFAAEHGADLKRIGNLIQSGETTQATALFRRVFGADADTAEVMVAQLAQGQSVWPIKGFEFSVGMTGPHGGPIQMMETSSTTQMASSGGVVPTMVAANEAAKAASGLGGLFAGLAGFITLTTVLPIILTGCLTVVILAVVGVVLAVTFGAVFR